MIRLKEFHQPLGGIGQFRSRIPSGSSRRVLVTVTASALWRVQTQLVRTTRVNLATRYVQPFDELVIDPVELGIETEPELAFSLQVEALPDPDREDTASVWIEEVFA
jgi:hypothetical protein